MAEAIESATCSEAKRSYSWWWDSHITPKNSKWLQENLTSMDNKIKSMIKLIEEDADSFARRAEMYYKKRPELMKLVEEFYRAYRALAERYDHVIGALRQAHRAIAVAFPNQIQSMLPDEPPSDSVEEENGDFPDENIPFMSREEWKHLNCLLVDEDAHKKFSEGLLMKGLNLTEDAGKNSELKKLQDEVFKLSIENKNLKNLIASESMRADKSETESQGLKVAVLKLKSQLEAEISRREDEVHRLNDEMSLKVTELNIAEERCLDLEEENRSLRFNEAESCGLRDAISKLNSELRNSLLQNKISQERISDLEAELCRSGDQLQKLNAEISIRSSKLNIAEEQYLVLQEENKSFQSMVNRFKMIAAKKDEEFTMREEELCKLKQLIEDERRRRMIAEVANQSLRKLCSQSEETIKLLGSEIRSGAELLRSKTGLEEEIKRLHEENNELSERSLSSLSKIVGLQDEINSLRRSKLEIAEDLRLMESLSERNSRFENSLSDVTAELEWLREKIKGLEECCESLRRNASSHESQNTVLVSHVDDVRKKMKKLSDKSTLFENSLCDIIFEFEGLRGKVKAMEESYKSTYNQNCDLIAENNNLVAQVEKIEQHMESLENRFSAFEEGKHVNMDIDRFIMKQILYDINEKNLFLSDKCGKYMDKLRCAEELTLELEHDQLVQEKKVALLVEHNKKISEWIHAFVREFDAKGDIESSNFGYKDIEEFHSIHFEKSPFNVLMEQLGLSLVELRAQKNVLEQESEKKNEEISLLRSDSYELMEVNELLRKDLNASNLQKEVLKIELEKMHRKLSDFEKMPFLAESECVSSNSFELREQADSQEEEHEAILEEFMINESLSCNFRSSDAENSSGIDQLINDVHNLHGLTNGLGQDIRVINQHLRDLAFDFETRKSALIEDDINKSRKNQFEQRIMEWSDSNPRFRNLQIKNKEGLMVEELEKKILHLSKENVYRDDENEFLLRTSEKFVGEISRLHKEAEALRRSEKNSTSEIRRAKDQIRILREESASYLLDINAASIIQLVFKQSVVELMLKVQSFEAGDCKQSEITIGEISPRRVRREDFMKKNDAFERKQGNNSFAPLQQKRICQVRDKDHAPKASAGIMELKMLHAKVKQLQKTVTNAERLLGQEEIAGDSNFASGTTKIKARRSKRSGITLQLEAEKKKDAIFRTGDEFCSETDEQSREMLGPATDNVSENQESTMVDETLSSDALRLSYLQENLEELKKSFEVSETSRHWSSSSSNAINEQLKISEGVIQQLIDINIKLTEMAGSSSASLDDSEGRRRVAKRAQMASEKIDAVEVELENTQCMFSKLLEEEESGAPKALQRKSRFPLKSFMYWRRNDSRQKKRLFCACMRLNNRGD